jgi:aryl sulfotransferase
MDEPLIARPIPRASLDPAEFFRTWLTEATLPSEEDGLPILSFFKFERTYWQARLQPNLLLVHYNDLKTDLDGEMRRISKYLDIPIREEVWPSLVRAADFETMRSDGGQLMPQAAAIFEGGAERFFHKGTNDRWKGVFRSGDLALYEAKLTNALGVECADWVTQGRLQR